jgi:ribosomal protein L32
VEKQTCRRKAPTITATGCPTCGTLGIPGTVCAGCVCRAHAAVVVRVALAHGTAHAAYGPDCDASRLLHDEHDRVLAGWAGAELLLDYFTTEPALWRVGFEVP